jgi:hypothetical protein
MSGLSVKCTLNMLGLSLWTSVSYGPDIVTELRTTQCMHFPNYARFIAVFFCSEREVCPVYRGECGFREWGSRRSMSGLSRCTGVQKGIYVRFIVMDECTGRAGCGVVNPGGSAVEWGREKRCPNAQSMSGLSVRAPRRRGGGAKYVRSDVNGNTPSRAQSA